MLVERRDSRIESIEHRTNYDKRELHKEELRKEAHKKRQSRMNDGHIFDWPFHWVNSIDHSVGYSTDHSIDHSISGWSTRWSIINTTRSNANGPLINFETKEDGKSMISDVSEAVLADCSSSINPNLVVLVVLTVDGEAESIYPNLPEQRTGFHLILRVKLLLPIEQAIKTREKVSDLCFPRFFSNAGCTT